MPAVDTFGATKADIERQIEHTVNTLVEGELSVGKISAVLGVLGAIETVTRIIADAEQRAQRAEEARDALQARLDGADPTERNWISERMDELQARIAQLQASRYDLSAQLANLAHSLRQ